MEKIKVLESQEDQVIRTARDKLASGDWRWVKNRIGDPEDGVCLIGALHYATAEVLSDSTLQADGWYLLFERVLPRVEAQVPFSFRAGRGRDPIPGFNDRQSTSLPDILEVLNKALSTEGE